MAELGVGAGWGLGKHQRKQELAYPQNYPWPDPSFLGEKKKKKEKAEKQGLKNSMCSVLLLFMEPGLEGPSSFGLSRV